MSYSIGSLYLSGALLLAQASSGTAEISPVMLLFYLVAFIFSGVCYQKIFQRLNMANDWLAWVPIANIWMIFKAGDQSPWWTVGMFIPFVNFAAIVFLIIAMVNIVKKLGKSPWLLWLMLVPFVSFWLMYHLAFQ
jgi:Family of unknown function (DUF5684)